MLFPACICLKVDQRGQKTAQAIHEALCAGVFTELLLPWARTATLTPYFPATFCYD